MYMKQSNVDSRFLAVYDTFVNEIFMFFFSKTWKRNLAKDLTQETFMKTWNDLSEGKIKGDMRSIHMSLKKNAESIITEKHSQISLAV